ncbi:hypothetical protein SELMODRAFT_116066, partial [Selaginella moellendorffii]
LGHFLLTNLLLDKMKETAKESVCQSLLHCAYCLLQRWNPLTFFLFSSKRYSNTRAYSQSKLTNIFHAKELAMRFKVFV